MFQQVCVNAEKWIPLLEVPPHELTAWLQQKKTEGFDFTLCCCCHLPSSSYTILGVEQTSTSKSLANYQFPDRVVLLLGKEKEGIPAEFLHLTDEV